MPDEGENVCLLVHALCRPYGVAHVLRCPQMQGKRRPVHGKRPFHRPAGRRRRLGLRRRRL